MATAPTPLPPQPGALRPLPPTPAPYQPRVKPTGLTQLFLANPLEFMRNRAVSPPDNSPWENDTGFEVGASKAVSNTPNIGNNGQVIGRSEGSGEVVRHTNAGGVRHIQMIQHVSLSFPGAVSLKFAPEKGFQQDGSWVPIYWLPWESLKVVECRIPRVPQALAEWDDEEFPRFFFTAGINGCSVFAHGHPHTPTLSHAGITGKLQESADTFWRKQMKKTKSGWDTANIRGEVNALEYAHSSVTARKLAEDYVKFIGNSDPEFRISVATNFGCVFGVRYGRSWTLYLQKSTLIEKVRFYKRAQLEERNVNYLDRLYVAGTDKQVLEQTQRVNLTLGPIKLPFKKDVQVYSYTESFCRPLETTEMYPNRGIVASFQSEVKRG